MIQIENLSKLSNNITKIPIFEREFELTLFTHPNNSLLNINIIRKI